MKQSCNQDVASTLAACIKDLSQTSRANSKVPNYTAILLGNPEHTWQSATRPTISRPADPMMTRVGKIPS